MTTLTAFRLSLSAVLVSAGVTGAHATPACYHGGLSYSVGSVIPLGSTPRECQAVDEGFAWVSQPETEANCFFEGKEYSRGSLISLGDSLRICAKGAWFDKDG